MKITTRFGEMEIDENKMIYFKEGLPGFERLKQFILLEDEESNFCYLQSVEDKDIAFTLISPVYVKSDYAPSIGESYFEKLGGGTNNEFILYNIITLRNPIEESTINLQAPLLIHVERRLGVQVIVEDKHYKVRENLMQLIKERG